MTGKKVRLKFKTYDLITRAVEEGAGFGFNRAFKHVDSGTTVGEVDRDQIEEAFVNEVMNALSEVVDFESGLE